MDQHYDRYEIISSVSVVFDREENYRQFYYEIDNCGPSGEISILPN